MIRAAGYVLLDVLALGIVLGIYALLRTSLRDLLQRTLRTPAGAEFYRRVLVIALVLGIFTKTLGDPFSGLKADAAAMEYVWKVADSLQDVIQSCLVILLVYFVLVTIVIAALKIETSRPAERARSAGHE